MKGQDVFSKKIFGHSDQLEGISLAEHYRWKNIELARQGKFGCLKSNLSSLKTNFSCLASHLDDTYTSLFISGAKGTGKKELLNEFTRIEKVYRKLSNAPDVSLRTYDAILPKELFEENSYLTKNIYIKNIEYLRADEQSRLCDFLSNRKTSIPYNAFSNRLFMSSESTLSFLSRKKVFSARLLSLISENIFFLPSLNDRLPDLLELFCSILFSQTKANQSPPAWLLNKIYLYSWPENIDTLVKMISYLVHQHGPMAQDWKKHLVLPEIQKFISQQNFDHSNTKEKASIISTLKTFEGDKEKTAQFLRISKNHLLEKMLLYKIRHQG